METEKIWVELVITVPRDQAGQAQAIATLFSTGGLYIEDYSDVEQGVWEIAHVDLIEQELLEKPRDEVKIHLYFSEREGVPGAVEALRERLNAAGVPFCLASGDIQQEDWANEWKKYYHTQDIGRRLAVVPSWEPYETDRIQLSMDPGMAFGTGTHETTVLCMEALDELVRGGERVLDIGTGSGILGIAAVLLGARSVLGIDIDGLAVDTANENARRNRVEDRFEARKGDLAAGVTGKFDMITANIIADAIVSLAPGIPGLLEPNGVFIASGIIDDRAQDVWDALQSAGFSSIQQRDKASWVLMLARK